MSTMVSLWMEKRRFFSGAPRTRSQSSHQPTSRYDRVGAIFGQNAHVIRIRTEFYAGRRASTKKCWLVVLYRRQWFAGVARSASALRRSEGRASTFNGQFTHRAVRARWDALRRPPNIRTAACATTCAQIRVRATLPVAVLARAVSAAARMGGARSLATHPDSRAACPEFGHRDRQGALGER